LAEVAGQPLVESLVAYLRERQLLLVVDNCEHLLEAAAAVVNRIMDEAGQVSLLVTSRERLGTAVERAYTLGPLSVPTTDSTDRDLVSRSETEALFAERVREARGGSPLTDDETVAAVDLCRWTEGIPLAIELVAAQAAVMPLPEMVSRLSEASGLELLDRDARSDIDRRRSMRLDGGSRGCDLWRESPCPG